MNKISKKIVALVTMAAFVLTLVPFAAFAAAGDYATFTPANENETVTLNPNQAVTVDVSLGSSYTNGNLVGIWVDSDSDNNADPDVIANVTATDDVTFAERESDQQYWGNAWFSTSTLNANDEFDVNVTFAKAGTYDLYAGVYTGSSGLQNTSDKTKIGTVTVYNTASSVQASDIVVNDVDNAKDITVDPDSDAKTVQFDVYDASGQIVADAPISDGDSTFTYVWATDEDGNFTDAISFADGAVATTETGTANKYVYEVNGGVVADDQTFTMNFVRPGTYYVYAGVSATDANTNGLNGTNANTAFDGDIDLVGSPIKVTINARNYDVETIELDATTTTGTNAFSGNFEDGYTWDISNDGTAANGTKVYRVTGTALQEDGTAAQYVNLNLDVNKSGLALSDEQVSTDKNGDFEFTFTVTKADIFKIDVTEEGNDKTSVELTVNKDQVNVSDITTVEDGGIMLSGDDDTYVNDVYDEESTLLTDAVQFEITDSNGNVVTGNTVLPSYKILVTAKPDKSTLDEENADNAFSLAWDAEDEVWTLAYNKSGNNVATDLIAGKYGVRVAFDDSTKAATASFTLAKFGEVQGLVFNGSDEVVLGEDVTGSVSYEDEQGIRVPVDADDVLVTAKGDALATGVLAGNNDSTATDFKFATKPHTVDTEVYYGSVITLTAFDSEIPSLVQKTVTVVAEDTDYSLAFDSTQGPANENNRVQVSVVDSDGDVVRTVAGETYAYVVSSSNEEAKVDVTPTDVASGKGSLTIYSDKETTLSIGVVVTDDNGEAIYAGNLEYTVGAEDVNADTTVVMTIGSSDLVVNNELVAGDAAPYVAESRTMVPIRVLTESFGAEVDFKDNVVTIVDGDTTIVMTIGETAYTVNDAEASMDVAPVIGSGDRTYVPVRFVAEALGYEVTPLYAADGTTASVLFQK